MWENYKKQWHGRRYYALDSFFKNQYGQKINKVAVDCGFTCPNRDGTLDTRGCIFCSAGGSGDFAVSLNEISCDTPYIAYFQAFTGTYGPLWQLRHFYEEALAAPLCIGLSIATRPDCLPPPIIDLLEEMALKYKDKILWIELGLQTIHPTTAAYIRRGYDLACFDTAVAQLAKIKIPVIVHTILGLPRETKTMLLDTIHHLNALPIFGIKLQLLHVLKGTDLATDYSIGHFEALTKEEYINYVMHCIGHLSPQIVIHRLTGDGPKDQLIAPLWSGHKKMVLNELAHQMKITDCYQGKFWKG